MIAVQRRSHPLGGTSCVCGGGTVRAPPPRVRRAARRRTRHQSYARHGAALHAVRCDGFMAVNAHLFVGLWPSRRAEVSGASLSVLQGTHQRHDRANEADCEPSLQCDVCIAAGRRRSATEKAKHEHQPAQSLRRSSKCWAALLNTVLCAGLRTEGQPPLPHRFALVWLLVRRPSISAAFHKRRWYLGSVL